VRAREIFWRVATWLGRLLMVVCVVLAVFIVAFLGVCLFGGR